MSAETLPVGTTFRTDVPNRLDRLLWSPWHWRVVIALGITWILDGLEASLIANTSGVLARPDTLGLSESQVGFATSVYLIGEIAGALFFGRMTDTFGRKKLFLVTLSVYLVGTAMTGLSTELFFFLFCRFVAGAGIGGEYAAINSAIDELIPARVRGRVDLTINGSYWVGVAAGAGLTLVLLDPTVIDRTLGWRLVFGLGAILGLAIVLVRKHVPESPRWLLMRGRVREAEEVVAKIEEGIRRSSPAAVPDGEPGSSEVKVTGSVGFLTIVDLLLRRHRKRTYLGLALMVSQSFFYNAIFFSYALILTRFYDVPDDRTGHYMIPFAVGNFLGPVLLGRLFDTAGRRRMISMTYGLSGLLLLVSGWLFQAGVLTPVTQTLAWCVIFFFASAAASSAYLTVSELFPVEIRGLAISVFFVVAQGAASLAVAVFGLIIESGSRSAMFVAYAVGAAFMVGAAVVAQVYGVDAEGKSLEQLAGPPES